MKINKENTIETGKKKIPKNKEFYEEHYILLGKSAKEIGEEFGYSTSYLFKILRRLGISKTELGLRKGHTPWNKGKHHSEETKSKIGKANSGRIVSLKTRNKLSLIGNNRPRKGYTIRPMGYIYIFCPNHPYANSHKYVFKHRLVMEKYLGRYLRKGEVVHHINNNRLDNRIENLKLFKNNSEHRTFHLKDVCQETRDTKGKFGGIKNG